MIKSSDLDKKKKISKFQDEIKTEKEDTKKLEEALIKIEKEINLKLEKMPNILHESTPLGKEESNNVEIKRYLEPRKFKFEPKDHVEIELLTHHIEAFLSHNQQAWAKEALRQKEALKSLSNFDLEF